MSGLVFGRSVEKEEEHFFRNGIRGSRRQRYPRSLADRERLSKLSGVTEARITELTEGGFLPHVEVDGRVWFRITAAREWITENLTNEREGMKLPEPKFLVLRDLDMEDATDGVPSEIRCVRELKQIPGASIVPPCVYFLCRNGKVVYVGQSVNLMSRLVSHAAGKDFDHIFYRVVPASQLDEVEAGFIHALKPELNRTKGRETESLGLFITGDPPPADA